MLEILYYISNSFWKQLHSCLIKGLKQQSLKLEFLLFQTHKNHATKICTFGERNYILQFYLFLENEKELLLSQKISNFYIFKISKKY